ncbi:transglutaminase domain-containing protein [Inconstantimicrobium mannanitabidum]|nr:transglutaminase domain-containing protein [Clostridium sp. TW13]
MRNMNNNVDILLAVIFVVPLILGYFNKFDSLNAKRGLWGFEKNVILILAGIICLFCVDKGLIINNVMEFLSSFSALKNVSYGYPKVFFLLSFFIVFTAIYYVLKGILYAINSLIMFPFLNGVESFSKTRGNAVKGLIGSLFSIPNAIIYVIIASLVINLGLKYWPSNLPKLDVNKSAIYKIVENGVINPVYESSFISQLPRILNNSLKIKVVELDKNSQNVDSQSINKANPYRIVYYNGVTLDQGIKSNSSINALARSLAQSRSSDREKAQAIYNWIGNNITYDDNKANLVLNGGNVTDSGAIPAFSERKGICFDYACLYVAMCRSDNLKVRLITGKGFNGYEWVGHAWNQVYLADEKVWINVDSTFYKAGNYFDSRKFDRDHKAEEISGEW